MIFRSAIIAKRETSHRCVGSVVRNVFDNRKAWSAVGAVDERVKKTPIRRVQELSETIGANRDIWGNGLEGVLDGSRVNDFKSGKPIRRSRADLAGVDPGERRCFAFQCGVKLLDKFRWTVDLDIDAGGGVSHPPIQGETGSKPENERPETDPLDNSGNVDARPRQVIHHQLKTSFQSGLFALSHLCPQPGHPLLYSLSCFAGKWKSDQPGIENFNPATEVIHVKCHIGEQVNLVDDERIDAAIHPRVFVWFVVAFGDGSDQNALVCTQLEASGTDQVAHVLYNQ